MICQQMNGYNSHKQMVFHQYEFEHGLVEAKAEKMIFHMFRIYMVKCVFECAFLMLTRRYNLWHKICMRKIFEFDLYSEVVGVLRIQIEWKILCGILCIDMALMKLYSVVWNDLVRTEF